MKPDGLFGCHTNHVLIRTASRADVPAIVNVHVAAWDAAKEGVDLSTRRTPEQRTEWWTSYLDRGAGTLLVAEEGGAVCGFIAFGDSRDEDRTGQLEVYTLYVEPSAWGHGIGSALMATVPSDRPVSLWVAERNARAREFYVRQGFAPDGAGDSGHHVPVIRLARTQG